MRLWALAACLVGLAGCGSAPPGSQSNPPHVTDVLHFDISADPANLDPLFAHPDAANVEQQLAHIMFEPFYDLDARGRPVPELLAEIPTLKNGGISADGRTLVYRLRSGLRWSDGAPLGARDVVFTVHAILDSRNPVASREGYELIDTAEALDAQTVRLHLKRAWAPAVSTFFTYGTAPQYVLPAHVLERAGPLARSSFSSRPGVGDGPYVLERWNRGDELIYTANPRYWRGRPRIDELDVDIVPDPNSNLTLLRSGAIGFNLIAPSQIPVLGANPRLAFARVPTVIVAGLALNVRHAPFDDPRVRRAFAMSIDRDAISAKITGGNYPVADSDRPRFSWAYDPSVQEPRYDPAAADRLFDAAGWRRGPGGRRLKGGKAMEPVYTQFFETTTGVRVAAFVQRELNDRGIYAPVKEISQAQFYLPKTGILARGDFDIAYVPWSMGADPDDRFLIACDGTANYMRYCNPAVDRRETEAVARVSQAERPPDSATVARLAAGDVPIVYLFNAAYVYAYDKRLHGFSPNAFTPTWNAYAWSLSPK
jgi:peptide/nickel transport system substrate-binding protein